MRIWWFVTFLLRCAHACTVVPWSPSPPAASTVSYTRAVSFEVQSTMQDVRISEFRVSLRASPNATSVWYRAGACSAGSLMSFDTQTYWRFLGVVTSPLSSAFAVPAGVDVPQGGRACFYVYGNTADAHIVRYSGASFTQGSVFAQAADGLVLRWGSAYYVNTDWNPADVNPHVSTVAGFQSVLT